ncbi:relaxase/mobilization nuclease domain-containing protein (plasmid) [Denitromonas sp. IR12]|uniref:Relaxase/mobilization nuclease domain-containing protein n=2 Tax=Denitromonas iodatirespirans TaxID=2795389 RepID=A0A944HA01_DENI1|nr:relaxase/mobilization nuclease domain-containing protein [Denitromonas iodatirespirans]
MPKRTASVVRTDESLFELVSRGRKGPGGNLVLSPGQVAAVARTVGRTPEVMVKVSGGAREVSGAKAHFSYIDRHGKLEIHTDEDRALVGKDAAAEMLDDWNLELSAGQYRRAPAKGEKDNRPKVVHNIVLSMPGDTPPEKVLAAAKAFAREQFALQYRYAMVLHTDQDHPHVHLVVKAEHEYEQGKRLYVRKATLRDWREAFASSLREQGVAANASPRQMRAENRAPKKDAIHQRLKSLAEFAGLEAAEKTSRSAPVPSTFMRRKVQSVADELKAGGLKAEAGKETLKRTRDSVTELWRSISAALVAQGEKALASQVDAFVSAMPKVRTEKEQIASQLLAKIEANRVEQRDAGKGRE